MSETNNLPIDYPEPSEDRDFLDQLIHEQEMLKHVHDLKKDLREKGFWERETPEVSQTFFLRSDEFDGQLGFKFE